jgi:hypothetical protein
MNIPVVSMAHKRLGLLSTFAMLVLIVSIARGLVPIMTGNGGLAQPVYNLSAVLGILLSCCGLYLAIFSRKQEIGPWPRLLLVANLALYCLWLLTVIVVEYDLTMISSIIYLGLFPFSVYGFVRLPEKKFISIAALLTLLIASYVIVEFSLINTQIIPGGSEKAILQQQLLRPDEFEAYGRTGSMLRPNGLFGSRPHDTANFLGMLFVFWLAILFRGQNNKAKISFVVIISLVGLFCTQSASNIIAALAGAVCVLLV